jgi:hypothetical protein
LNIILETNHRLLESRNSVAVLNGKETKELAALGEDIFRYFGLGCRNVSKLLYQKDTLLMLLKLSSNIKMSFTIKYANNYDYNKAVFLMSNFKLLDNGF